MSRRYLPVVFGLYVFFLQTAVAQKSTAVSSVNTAHLNVLKNELSRGKLFELAASENAEGISKSQRAQLFSLWGPFTFPYDTKTDKVEKKDRPPAVFGIDISHYTPTNIPLHRLSENNIQFVYVKATQGKNFKDGNFRTFWNRLRLLPDGKKVYRGAYHFLTADDDPVAQAETFVAVLKSSGASSLADMPPVVDLEWDIPKKGAPDRWAKLSPADITARINTWLSYVKLHTGTTPMIYTSGVWWKQRIGDSIDPTTFGAYPIWVADYSKSSRGLEKPFVPGKNEWAVWQFTDGAKLDSGFAEGLDANIVPGSDEAFASRFGLPPLQRF
jgi:lysozyme